MIGALIARLAPRSPAIIYAGAVVATALYAFYLYQSVVELRATLAACEVAAAITEGARDATDAVDGLSDTDLDLWLRERAGGARTR